jgi:hypothetical protein
MMIAVYVDYVSTDYVPTRHKDGCSRIGKLGALVTLGK